MKKYKLTFFLFALVFASCKHEPIIPDVTYLNQTAYDKIADYWNGFTTNNHNTFSISYVVDTSGKQQLYWSCHINYNHTLDSIKVNDSQSFKLPNHFGGDVVNNSLSNSNDQMVSFQIRSKTPHNEIMTGTVFVSKPQPISAIDLGNNTFNIKWTPQNRRERVLIYLTYFRVYVQRLNYCFAVETEDDGEYTFAPSIFEQFRETNPLFISNDPTETVAVRLLRLDLKRKTVIKQPSTGTQYSVFGGGADATTIQVLR